ncbi:hypothetical protein [Candidatus Lokiarchaeum ossiferum]
MTAIGKNAPNRKDPPLHDTPLAHNTPQIHQYKTPTAQTPTGSRP